MSSSGVEELAEDYKSSLEDLTFNSRWEITNLTVIAKENIHAAQAISKVIEDHIQQTAPARKLPALYLLDSVAKNVGTPYTLFFGRNLYRTFMDAYSLVDPQVRRKLEEMLQTWKQPVPNSPSPTPVFPSEVTRRIDNALIKARTAAVQAHQKQMKEDQAKFGINRSSTHGSGSGGPNAPFKSAPTPPNGSNAPYQVVGQSQKSKFLEPTLGTSSPSSSTTGNSFSVHHLGNKVPLPLPIGAPALEGIDSLHNDVDALVKSTQKKFSETPFDQEVQRRLTALLDLQKLLLTTQLPAGQISIVRDQVAKLASPSPPPPPAIPPPAPFQLPQGPFPGSNVPNLAALLSAMPLPASSQTTPLTGLPLPAILGFQPGSSHMAQPIQKQSPSATGDLFSSLLSAGLLPSQGKPQNAAIPPADTASLLSSLLPNAASTRLKPSTEPQGPSLLVLKLAEVELTSASLKLPRPHLLSILNESLPNRCSSCPRRFEDSDQGKREKASHLDWHFKVHQRMTENAKRGQNRSWYVGEEEWIKSRDEESEVLPLNAGTVTAGNDPSSNVTLAGPSTQSYVPVPNDPALANAVCPICKEKFEPTWHGEAEEWVWMDAVKVAGRIYHASCHAEVSKNGGVATPHSRGSTPDVGGFGADGLGKSKRKAEDSASTLGKTKRERL